MDQHGQAALAQQTGKQRGQIGLLARAVIAGDDHHGHGSVGLRPCGKALVRGIEKTRQFFGTFALEAHGNAKAAQLQVADLAVEHLSHQVAGLCTRQGTGSLAAAANFLDVMTDAHDSTIVVIKTAAHKTFGLYLNLCGSHAVCQIRSAPRLQVRTGEPARAQISSLGDALAALCAAR